MDDRLRAQNQSVLDSDIWLPEPTDEEAVHQTAAVMLAQSRRRLSLILFAATAVSMFVAGMDPGGNGFFTVLLQWPRLTGEIVWQAVQNGLTYSVALLAILFAHEMGHYVQARRYGVPATPPFFIPLPISPFGTMGAVILQDGRSADRRVLFDIAISGPIAGLVVALPIVWFGVAQADVKSIPADVVAIEYGDPLLIQWMVAAAHGTPGPDEAVMLNPLLFAGWVGVFITALNLIPIGQLDGGHMLYAMIGRRAHPVAIGLLLLAVGYMVFTQYYAYSLIVMLLILFGPRHPPSADDRVPLGRLRYVLGWLTLAFIVIGFTPTPIVTLQPL